MKNIKLRLSEIAKETTELEEKLREKKSNLRFECGCGKTHRIKDCTAIQTHYYIPPSGCTDGAYWSAGGLEIICPDKNVRNRCLFNNYDIDYFKRGDYDNNAENQFIRTYSPLFKEVINDYNTDKRGFWNNYYFDNNHKKFDLCVKDRDYKSYKPLF